MSRDKGINVIVKKHYHEHDEMSHGVWKLAYADFMTGLMAFFIFMWIINLVSADQSAGLSSYFAPPVISDSKQGVGLPDNGQSPQDNEGGKITTFSTLAREANIPRFGEDYDGDLQGMIRENNIFTKTGSSNSKPNPPDGDKLGDATKKLKQSLLDKFRDIQVQNSIVVEEVPEGIKIQLLDGLKKRMFVTRNGTNFTDYFERIMELIADLAKDTPFNVSIDGYSQQFYAARGVEFTAWELSLERALSVYRFLQLSGINEDRFVAVNGNADNDLYYTSDASNIANNRISITLLDPSKHNNVKDEKGKDAMLKSAPSDNFTGGIKP